MTELILAVVGGVIALWCFFFAVKTQWPESYVAVNRAVDREISASPLRYMLFRFAPVVVVTAFVAATMDQAGEPFVLAALLVGLIHAAATAGRAFVGLIRHGGLAAQPLVAAFRVIVFIACIAAAGIGAALGPTLSDYVPSGHELAFSLWTALFAAVGGATLIALSRPPGGPTSGDDGLQVSLDSIDPSLWAHARNEAQRCNADLRLVQAIMLVENLQRPSWVRKLERAGGRVFGRGTFGPFQISGDGSKSRTERQSISEAIETRFANQRVPNSSSEGYESEDHRWLPLFAWVYNPDAQFGEDVQMAYHWLEWRESKSLATTDGRADDGLPTIELLRFSIAQRKVRAAGTVVAPAGFLRSVQLDIDGVELASEDVAFSSSPSGRGDWALQTPLVHGVARLVLTTDELSDPPDSNSSIILPAYYV